MPSSAAEDGVGDPNTMRILLATDIHLGYAEKHPVKGRQGLDIWAVSQAKFCLKAFRFFALLNHVVVGYQGNTIDQDCWTCKCF